MHFVELALALLLVADYSAAEWYQYLYGAEKRAGCLEWPLVAAVVAVIWVQAVPGVVVVVVVWVL